jgi:hypothetical protein
MSLINFKVSDIDQFLFEKGVPINSSSDFRIMFVGKDDVHEALKYVLSNITSSLYLNMYGYDDEELNAIVMNIIHNPLITCLITLDKSQAGGRFEKELLESDAQKDPVRFNTTIVLGESVTHQISHTKGFVADGIVGCEGSTNWSQSGEGIFKLKNSPGGVGYKAQNNTQTFFTCPYHVQRFQNELIFEHVAAQKGLLKENANELNS